MTRLSSNYQKYYIPLIPNDLRQEETIHQVADAFEHLKKVADDVFNKVERRVEESRLRLHKINERIDKGRAQVEKIRGSNKATKIFSSSKYPILDTPPDVSTMFSTEKSLESIRRMNYKLKTKHDVVDEKTLKEKLTFFNVLPKEENKANGREKGEGLGRLPRETSSVSSLLLFNTSENPYKKYVLLDPLGVVTKTRTALQAEFRGPGDAPSTIMHGESLEQRQKETYFYSPGMGAVPEISVPDDLPLFGVAGDVLYKEETGPSIAPSVFGKDTIPELPIVELLTKPSPTQTATSSQLALPPPPPPLPSNIPLPPPPSNMPPPPPPPVQPPPPPPAFIPSPAPVVADLVMKMPDAEIATQQPTASSKSEQSADRPNRSSLLDDIRGAGQSRLKSVKEKKVEKKKEKEVQKVESSGGDLMSDLAAKLQLRRKGISGGGTGKASGSSAEDGAPKPPEVDRKAPTSALDRMSSLISYSPSANKDTEEWSD